MQSARIQSPARTPGHSRQSSIRRQALRRSTVGPLDAEDDPLASDTASLTLEPADNDPLSASTTDISPLPNRHSHEYSPSPVPEPAVTVIDQAAKNFGFLIRPENFLPIEQHDIPAPFRESPPEHPTQKSLLEALHDGHYRASAVIAGELLKTCRPEDRERIFRLLYVRLACLQIAGLHAHAAQEAKPLQDLNAPFFRDRGRHLVPWDLRVLVVRLQAIGFGDWRRGIMQYYELAREARFELRRAPEGEKPMWKMRLQDLGLRVGNALIEISDMEGAIRHFKTLSTDGGQGGAAKARLALLYLRCGDVDAARTCFRLGDQHSRMLHPLCTMGEGKFQEASTLWATVRSGMHEQSVEAAVVDQALAVCKVYMGQIHEARETLESLVQPQGALHGVTFNLSTIYELSSENSSELKLKLAEHIASQPAAGAVWDKSSADFKL